MNPDRIEAIRCSNLGPDTLLEIFLRGERSNEPQLGCIDEAGVRQAFVFDLSSPLPEWVAITDDGKFFPSDLVAVIASLSRKCGIPLHFRMKGSVVEVFGNTPLPRNQVATVFFSLLQSQ